jgi:hypothetical protein
VALAEHHHLSVELVFVVDVLGGHCHLLQVMKEQKHLLDEQQFSLDKPGHA